MRTYTVREVNTAEEHEKYTCVWKLNANQTQAQCRTFRNNKYLALCQPFRVNISIIPITEKKITARFDLKEK